MKNIIILITSMLLVVGLVYSYATRDLEEKKQPVATDERVDENEAKEIESSEKTKAENPLSLATFASRKFNGSDFTVGQVLSGTEAYTRYYITYKSGDLSISGVMNVPTGEGPFPLLVLNHGYIDPAIYTNGRGLKREQDYLAREGYVVIHPDYRNHADSDSDPDTERNFRLGYVEDVINLIKAVTMADLPYIQEDNIGMLGHSMGGGIAQTIMVTHPELVDAFVLFAPVSADVRDNFNKWTRSREEVASEIIESYGAPGENKEFWDSISPLYYVGKTSAPVMIHHGTADTSVPIAWSEKLVNRMEEMNKEVSWHAYPGEPHEFIDAWPQVMQRTTHFFNEHL